MSTLRDFVPHEFFAEFMDTRAATMLDVEVEEEHSLIDFCEDKWVSWPGTHKNVYNWVKLVDGRCVGWNESPSRGWSFPVFGKKTKK